MQAMIRRDYLIIGAGTGGASVCEGIREHDAKGTIMMVGSETALPYERARLFSSVLGKTSAAPANLPIHDAAWYAKHHIDLRLNTVVTQLNLERHLAVLTHGQTIEFKKACLATGSRPRRPQAPGANLGNVFYLRSMGDVEALREMLEFEKEIAVIGGGCVAAEIAALLSQRSKARITLVHRGKHLWARRLDEETGLWLNGVYAKNGVKLLMGETLNGFEGRTVVRNVQTKSGLRVAANLAIVAIGAEMNNGLFLNTPLNYPTGTPVNEMLETDEKGIFAVGDLALYPDKIFGGQRRVDHWGCAAAQGRIAGANMSGKKRIKWEWMPHLTRTVFDLHFDFVGDFSRPSTRFEIEGDRAKKKFIIRHYNLTVLSGVTLCNQPEAAVEAAKTQVRDWKREVKRYES